MESRENVQHDGSKNVPNFGWSNESVDCQGLQAGRVGFEKGKGGFPGAYHDCGRD